MVIAKVSNLFTFTNLLVRDKNNYNDFIIIIQYLQNITLCNKNEILYRKRPKIGMFAMKNSVKY